MQLLKRVLVIAALFYLPLQSQAWSLTGHRVVGGIAESYLTPKARKAITALLGNESLAMVANWPDFVKSDPAYNYLSNWHYINFEDGFSFQAMHDFLEKDTSVNAYTKVNFMVKELKKGNLSRETKIMYVKLIVHIIGDLHQPMHVGRLSDLGGNRVKVMWFNEATNLHAVWDDKLVDFQQLSYTEYINAINFTTAEQRKAWQSDSFDKWIYDSYAISRKLYEEIKQPDQKLSYRYNFDHIKTVNEQLLKGGVRLAGVLNGIFG
ncbi:S1/P1 nuclease [Sediminibacterium ginsengisoli]|uniref:S1/P1 Nuclease n=1 Tax=Sediminibacterium ginsengisoli TaxID=413434 RepID=A0A1T4KCA5_9BACT|nr:S1/P1 nuclease [Sediminibacterium ginsengisoli]SJZ39945.1 S1/P1 Nuclease [Sediminibacterium ginsengisoli]